MIPVHARSDVGLGFGCRELQAPKRDRASDSRCCITKFHDPAQITLPNTHEGKQARRLQRWSIRSDKTFRSGDSDNVLFCFSVVSKLFECASGAGGPLPIIVLSLPSASAPRRFFAPSPAGRYVVDT